VQVTQAADPSECELVAHHAGVGEAPHHHNKTKNHVHAADAWIIDAGDPLAPQLTATILYRNEARKQRASRFPRGACAPTRVGLMEVADQLSRPTCQSASLGDLTASPLPWCHHLERVRPLSRTSTRARSGMPYPAAPGLAHEHSTSRAHLSFYFFFFLLFFFFFFFVVFFFFFYFFFVLLFFYFFFILFFVFVFCFFFVLLIFYFFFFFCVFVFSFFFFFCFFVLHPTWQITRPDSRGAESLITRIRASQNCRGKTVLHTRAYRPADSAESSSRTCFLSGWPSCG